MKTMNTHRFKGIGKYFAPEMNLTDTEGLAVFDLCERDRRGEPITDVDVITSLILAAAEDAACLSSVSIVMIDGLKYMKAPEPIIERARAVSAAITQGAPGGRK